MAVTALKTPIQNAPLLAEIISGIRWRATIKPTPRRMQWSYLADRRAIGDRTSSIVKTALRPKCIGLMGGALRPLWKWRSAPKRSANVRNGWRNDYARWDLIPTWND